jgi:hypothetical protein
MTVEVVTLVRAATEAEKRTDAASRGHSPKSVLKYNAEVSNLVWRRTTRRSAAALAGYCGSVDSLSI